MCLRAARRLRHFSAGFPNSVTQHGDLVYVLNSGGAGSITGFRLSNQGTLTPIPGSTRGLDANQSALRPDTLFNPAEVSFTPDGRQLVVTIKDAANDVAPGVVATAPGRVLVFSVGRDGRPSDDFIQTDLDNHGPFGFSFDRHGNLIIALFLGSGPPGFTAAVGSFNPNADGMLTGITPDVLNGQFDTCWVENNGKYAYTANYTSGNVSSYSIGNNGRLSLLKAMAGFTSAPVPPKTQGSTPSTSASPTMADSCMTSCQAPGRSPAGASTTTTAASPSLGRSSRSLSRVEESPVCSIPSTVTSRSARSVPVSSRIVSSDLGAAQLVSRPSDASTMRWTASST